MPPHRSTIFFSQHLSRTINIISIFCWLIPLTIMIVWFSSTPCQGFQTAECDYLFLLGSAYRYMVLSVFLLPLVLMSIIYVRIFIIISRHQRGRRVEHERSTLTRGVISVTGPIGSAAAVNLPELMSRSQTEEAGEANDGANNCFDDDDERGDFDKCSVCAGNKRRRRQRRHQSKQQRLSASDVSDDEQEGGQSYDDDEQSVSMLSEEAPDENDNSNSSMTSDDNDGDEREEVREINRQQINQVARNDKIPLVQTTKQLALEPTLKITTTTKTTTTNGNNHNPLASESTLLCDKLSGQDGGERQSRAAGGQSKETHNETNTCGQLSSSSDKALVFIVQGAARTNQNAGPVHATPRAIMKLKRAETTAATNQELDERATSLRGVSLVDHASATNSTAAVAPTKPPRETLRTKFSLSSRTSAELAEPEINPRLTYERQSRERGGSSRSSSRKGGLKRTIGDTGTNSSVGNLENLLLRKCTCDNKLRHRQASAARGQLARANTIGFKAQSGSNSPPAAAAADRGTSAHAASSGVASSIQNGLATSSLRLQLRRSPTTPAGGGGGASGNLKGRLTATTSMATTHSSATSTAVTRTVSNSHGTSVSSRTLVPGGGGGLAKTIDNQRPADTIPCSPSSTVTTQQPQQQQHEPTRRHVHASAVPQTNTKALITTLLILGTYFVSYAPAIIYQVLTCIDHCPYPLYDISYGRRVLFGAMTTLMLIAKSIVDPLIYSYRMNEIQMAISRYLSKRRSKSSSHAASMHTSQRFTFGGLTSAANGGGVAGNSTAYNPNHHSLVSHHHHHKHHSFNKSHNNLNSETANSSIKTIGSATTSLRDGSSAFKARATSQAPLTSDKLIKSRGETSNVLALNIFSPTTTGILVPFDGKDNSIKRANGQGERLASGNGASCSLLLANRGNQPTSDHSPNLQQQQKSDHRDGSETTTDDLRLDAVVAVSSLVC